MMLTRRSAGSLLRKLPKRLEVPSHARGANEEGCDANSWRRPSNVLEEVKQLTNQAGFCAFHLDATEMREQPGHLQQCANGKHESQSPPELRNK
jgi:hypothetical protein